MNSESYKTIKESSAGIYKEKKSKFFAFAIPVFTEKEIKSHLKIIKTNNQEASHNCYAYILGTQGEISRQNDDGEPFGSAGRPIHGQLLSFNLTNVLLVVTRYYGGAKLGIPGLISAYKAAARDAIQNAVIIEKIVQSYFEIVFDYPMLKNVEHILKNNYADIVEQKFDEKCYIKIAVQESKANTTMKYLKELRSIQIKPINLLF